MGRRGQQVAGRHHDVVQEHVGRRHAPEAHEALRRAKVHARRRARDEHRADALPRRAPTATYCGPGGSARWDAGHACARRRARTAAPGTPLSRAKTTMSECPPPEVHRFCPLSTMRSPSTTARVVRSVSADPGRSAQGAAGGWVERHKRCGRHRTRRRARSNGGAHAPAPGSDMAMPTTASPRQTRWTTAALSGSCACRSTICTGPTVLSNTGNATAEEILALASRSVRCGPWHAVREWAIGAQPRALAGRLPYNSSRTATAARSGRPKPPYAVGRLMPRKPCRTPPPAPRGAAPPGGR